MSEQGVASVSTWVGSGVPRFYLPLDQVFPQSNVSQLIVLAKDLKVRETLRVKLPALLASEFPEVRGRVKLLPNGPPVPYPVQFRVVGADPSALRLKADEVKAAMRSNANTRGVNDNWNESVKVIRLEVDQAKARTLGVTSQSIAMASRTMSSGSNVGQYRDGDKLIDIALRQPLSERDAITDLAGAYVPTASGKSIPLLQIAKPVFNWEPGVMWREGRNYAITVNADVIEGIQGATVTNQLLPELKNLEAKWRDAGQGNFRIEVAGAVEESSKGSASIAAGLPLMLFVTFTLLMLQLQSFSRALLVFLTGPLGMAGVAGALLVLDRPFGFVALLGVIALMGMIQRNSVILIDQIEQDRAAGVPAWATGTASAPVTKTADFTLADGESWVINNKSGSTCTVTLPTPSAYSGRQVTFKNMQAQLLVSASSNVVPIDSTVAGTAILLAVVGNSATMVSDGSNWVIMQASSNNNLLLE